MELKVGISREDLANVCGIVSRAFGEIAALLGTSSKAPVNQDKLLNEWGLDRGFYQPSELDKITAAGKRADCSLPKEQVEHLKRIMAAYGYDGTADDSLIRCSWCAGARNSAQGYPFCICVACGREVMDDGLSGSKHAKDNLPSIEELKGPFGLKDPWVYFAQILEIPKEEPKDDFSPPGTLPIPKGPWGTWGTL